MHHQLKIHPKYYARVADGSKTFEVRKNDRGFQPGDTVELREWDPEPVQSAEKGSLTATARGYTDAKHLTFRIGYILVLDSETVVFSLLPVPAERKKAKPEKT